MSIDVVGQDSSAPPSSYEVVRWSDRAREHHLRRRLVIVAPTVAGLVAAAGGWLFDQVMAGWDVTAVVADPANTRPLRILGAGVVDLESTLASQVRGPRPHRVAVDVDLYRTDERTRSGLRTLFDDPTIELLLWGGALPEELDHRFVSVEHAPSSAARAFKSRALVAAARPGVHGPTELFHGLPAEAQPSDWAWTLAPDS